MEEKATIVLLGDDGNLRQAFTRSLKDANKFFEGIKSGSSNVEKLGKTMVGTPLEQYASRMLGVDVATVSMYKSAFMAGGSLTAFSKVMYSAAADALALGSQLSDMSTKTGMTSEAIQRLTYAGSMVGVSIESISGAIGFMNRNMADAPEKFAALGLSVAALKAMSPEQAFMAISEAIKKLPGQAEQTAAAMDIFGRGGREVLGLLKSDMVAVGAEAVRMGIVLGDDMVGKLDATEDSATKAGAAWKALWTQFGAAVAQSPVVTGALEKITAALTWMNQKWKEESERVMTLEESNALYAAQVAAKRVANEQAANVTIAKVREEQVVLFKLQELEQIAAQERRIGHSAQAAAAQSEHAKLLAMTTASAYLAITKAAQESAEAKVKASATAATKEIENAKKRAAEAIKIRQQEADAQFSSQKKLEEMFADQLEKQKNAQEEARNRASEALSREVEEEKREREKNLQDNLDMIKTEEEARKAAAQATTESYRNALQSLANLFQVLGAGSDNFFGSMVGGALNALTMMDQLKNATTKTAKAIAIAQSAAATFSAGYQSGSAGKGALSGVMTGAITGAAFGPIGALAGGAIGGAIGAIGGLFGGKKKKKEEAAAKKKAQDDAIANVVPQMQGIMDKVAEIKSQMMTAGIGGLASVFENMAKVTDLSGERLNRLGVVGMAMFNSLKKSGMTTVQALKEMSPALEQARAAAEASGQSLTGPFATLAAYQEKVAKNEGLVSAAEGMGQAMTALRSTGSLDAATMGAMSAETGDIFKQLTGAGFTESEALNLIAPALLQIKTAADQMGMSLDPATQALFDQANAAGALGNIQDPMQQLVDAQKVMIDLIAEMVKLFGGTLPASMEKFKASTAGIVPNLGAATTGAGVTGATVTPLPGGQPPTYTQVPMLLTGGIIAGSGLAYVHSGERVDPDSGGFDPNKGSGFDPNAPGVESAIGDLSDALDGLKFVGNVSVSYAPNVQISGAQKTDHQMLMELDRALRNNTDGIAARVKAVVEGRI